MGVPIYYNNTSFKIEQEVSPVDTVIKVADTLNISAPENGDYIIGTIQPVGGYHDFEIIHIVDIDNTTNELTIERAQEGTSPQAFLWGSVIALQITADALNAFSIMRSSRKSLISYYGAKGDGITDDSARITEALNDAAERNGSIIVDDAQFNVEQKIIVSSEISPFGMEGEGNPVFLFTNPDSCGFDLAMPYANSTRSSVKTTGAPKFRNFTLMKAHTDQVCTGKAMKIRQVGVPPGEENPGRPGIHLICSTINMMTLPSLGTTGANANIGWLDGLDVGRPIPDDPDADIGGGVLTHLDHIYFSGSVNRALNQAGSGIIFDTAIGSRVTQCQVFNTGKAYHIKGNTEGPSITNSGAVRCDYFLYDDAVTSNPGLDISGCHSNTYLGFVVTKDRNMPIIIGNLIFIFTPGSSATEDFVAFELQGGTGGNIIGNTLNYLGGTRNNQLIAVINDNTRALINSNTVYSATESYRITGDSEYVMWTDNNIAPVAPGTDTSTGAGTTNVIQDRKGVAGAYTRASLASNQTTTSGSDTIVLFNQVVDQIIGGPLIVPASGRFNAAGGDQRHSFTGQISFSGSPPGGGTGNRTVQILKNGSTVATLPHITEAAISGSAKAINFSTGPLELSGSDYLQVRVSQDSGEDIDILAAQTWAVLEVIA